MSEPKKERSDALFDELSRKKKKRRNKIIRTVVIVIVMIAVVLMAAVSAMTQRVREQFQSAATEVLNYAASRGTISTTVSGSGTLAEVDLEALTVPAGVEIVEVVVEADASVHTGDVLATVDMSSVMSALAKIQAEIDDLDEQIGEARGEEVSSYIEAGVEGRVKLVYAQENMSVASCMAEHGALAVLSLDGYMAVDIPFDGLSRGDEVIVIRADGTEIEGVVDTSAAGNATVKVTDKGPEYGEEVTVLLDGTQIGTGMLYIHAPLRITGYAGTVSRVYVEENEWVYSYTDLFYLKDTSTSASYDALLRQREEQEAILVELMTIYRDGAILSPMDGIISSVEYGEEEVTTSMAAAYMGGAAVSTEPEDTALLTIYPNISMSVSIPIDETDILALRIGQEADVEVSSVSTDTLYTGIVTETSITASVTSGVTQYSAVVTLDKAPGMLPGMTAGVDIKIEGVENTIIIPADALHETSTISFVYTSYDPETAQYGGRVEVTTGMRNDDFVEITSGLNEGDVIYYVEARQSIFDFFSQMPGGFRGQMPSGFRGFGG